MGGEYGDRNQYNQYRTAEPYDALVGRTVVLVSACEDFAELYLDSGEAFRFELYGDCCSTSHFTPDAAAAFSELLGAKVVAVEDRDNESPADKLNEQNPGDVNKWHFLVFTTDKGHVTIDWRNDSNGYYDGSVSLQAIEGLHPAAHDLALEGRTDLAMLLQSTAIHSTAEKSLRGNTMGDKR